MPHYLVVFGEEDHGEGIVMGMKRASTPQDAIVQCAREAITDDIAHRLEPKGAVGMAEWILNGAIDESVDEDEQEMRMSAALHGAGYSGGMETTGDEHYTAYLLAEDDFGSFPASFRSTEIDF